MLESYEVTWNDDGSYKRELNIEEVTVSVIHLTQSLKECGVKRDSIICDEHMQWAARHALFAMAIHARVTSCEEIQKTLERDVMEAILEAGSKLKR